MLHFLVLLVTTSAVTALAFTTNLRFDAQTFERNVCSGFAGHSICDETCKLVGICINGNFVTTKNCSTQFCVNSDQGADCQPTEGNCTPLSQDVGCLTGGTFPDPFDCHGVVTCEKAGDMGVRRQFCSPELGYDPCTGLCEVKLDNNKCAATVDLCKNQEKALALPDNKRIYYFCQLSRSGLHPVFGRCPNGFFNEATSDCVSSTDIGCGVTCPDPGPDPSPSPSPSFQ